MKLQDLIMRDITKLSKVIFKEYGNDKKAFMIKDCDLYYRCNSNENYFLLKKDFNKRREND